MGYPTSIFTPAARSNGQTIDAAHMNDVQAELTALESALLGTITHPLNITAESSFTVRPVMPPPDAARVFLEVAMVTGSSQLSTLSFLGQSFLTNSSMHSTGTNPERLTPQSTGVYFAVAQIALTSTEAGVRGLHITDSSNIDITEVRQVASSRGTFLLASGYKRFDVLGGHLRVVAENNVGATTNTISSGQALSWFAMHKL